MLGITHFAFGAVGGILINQKLKKDRLVLPVISGLFAMLPDLNKIIENRISEYMSETIINNIFWFHGFLDSIETAYPELEGGFILFILFIASIYTSQNNKFSQIYNR